MCGEHKTCQNLLCMSAGSSPHVRGARHGSGRWNQSRGIIPACAGSTPKVTLCMRCVRDHPRMCGEHTLVGIGAGFAVGSSPHVRGAQEGHQARLQGHGIIPACAGSTRPIRARLSRPWDHPRMCGEHNKHPDRVPPVKGSSPHVRGARWRRTRRPMMDGIIPACAGSTEDMIIKWHQAGDHPRMCGEHGLRDNILATSPGSSPHVRGARQSNARRIQTDGIIPACAGSTGKASSTQDSTRDHPRMCGEHLRSAGRTRIVLGSSPHVRGAHTHVVHPAQE